MSGTLNHSPAKVIKQLLIDLGYASYPESVGAPWPLYWDFFPDSPDEAACITDTSPRLQGREHITGQTQEQYGFQIMLRSTADLAKAKANELCVVLDTLVRYTTVEVEDSTYTVYATTRASGPLRLGRETPNTHPVRALVSINYVVTMIMVGDVPDSGTGTGTGTH